MSETLRVLWVTGNLYPIVGGLETYTENVIRALSRVTTVGVISAPGQQLRSSTDIWHSTCHGIKGSNNAAEDRETRVMLADLIAQFRPEVVHFANAGVAVYADCCGSGIPIVVTVHGNDLTAPWHLVPKGSCKTAIVSSLDRCTQIVAVSAHTARLVSEQRISAPVKVIYGATDFHMFRRLETEGVDIRQVYGLPKDRALVLTAGRMAPRKGHLSVLAALANVQAPLHWVITGNGPTFETLRTSIARTVMDGRVSLVGWVPVEHLVRLYGASDVFVLTPHELRNDDTVDSEGFGLVYREAGACEVPVVASNTGGCREAVIDKITGYLVDPCVPDQIASAVSDLLRHPLVARRLGRNGRTLAIANGGWSRVADEMMQTYIHVRHNGYFGHQDSGAIHT